MYGDCVWTISPFRHNVECLILKIELRNEDKLTYPAMHNSLIGDVISSSSPRKESNSI